MDYILRRQEPQTCRILVNLLTTKETKPNKERVIPRHEEHHHLQGDPDGCQGSSLATCSLPSTTTKSWTNFCTVWPLPRAWAALLGGHVGVLVKQRKRAPQVASDAVSSKTLIFFFFFKLHLAKICQKLLLKNAIKFKSNYLLPPPQPPISYPEEQKLEFFPFFPSQEALNSEG